MALGGGHVRDGFVEVCLVLGAGVPGLEEQDQFGGKVGNSVRGAVDDLAVGKADRLVVPADPGLAVVRLAEHVKQVVAGGRVAQPGLWCVASSTSGAAFCQIRPLLTASKAYPGKRSRTSGKLAAGIAISMSPWSRVCLPRNRSSAQPAATHQGVVIPARCRATWPGVQHDDHLASRASISAGDSSVPPTGSCSLTGRNLSAGPRQQKSTPSAWSGKTPPHNHEVERYRRFWKPYCSVLTYVAIVVFPVISTQFSLPSRAGIDAS